MQYKFWCWNYKHALQESGQLPQPALVPSCRAKVRHNHSFLTTTTSPTPKHQKHLLHIMSDKPAGYQAAFGTQKKFKWKVGKGGCYTNGVPPTAAPAAAAPPASEPAEVTPESG